MGRPTPTPPRQTTGKPPSARAMRGRPSTPITDTGTTTATAPPGRPIPTVEASEGWWRRSSCRTTTGPTAGSGCSNPPPTASGRGPVPRDLATTAAVELVVALLSHSVALLADTIHNFADALTAVPLALAFRLGRRAAHSALHLRLRPGRGPRRCGHRGHHRRLHRLRRLRSRQPPHAPPSRPRAGWVMAAGGVGFLGNELVAVYRVRVGRRIGSAALVADGMHARSDGFTSLAVVVGAIAVVGRGTARRSDRRAGDHRRGDRGAVRRHAHHLRRSDGQCRSRRSSIRSSNVLPACPGSTGVDDIRIRWVGHELRAEIQISSEPTLSLVDAHAIAEEAHHRLLHEVSRLAEAVIHTSPTGDLRARRTRTTTK